LSECKKVSAKAAQKVESATKIIAPVAIPLSVYNIGKAILEWKTSTLDKRIDDVFTTITEIGSITDCISTCAIGMNELKILSATAVVWATPLTIVGGVLSVASIISDLRYCYQQGNVLDELNIIQSSSTSFPEEDYEKLLNWINSKDDYY